MLLTCKAFGVGQVPVEQSTLRVTPRALPARHAALDTVIVVGGVWVKTGQVSQGSRLSIAGGHARHAALDTVIVVGGVRVKTGQVSQGSRLSAALGVPTAGVPGWACGHARQPRQTPSRGGSRA